MNVKHCPLINVLAVNSCSTIFMYVEGFMGVQKSRAEIANFLIGTIQTIGPSSVLPVVTDNAANCKAVGKETRKVPKWEKSMRGWTTWLGKSKIL
ncbi:hypothetical protein QVD17_09120 [Tagetes erecta]|uniref:DUF659 domain-containing protein n=1 Tax=Tagetes erecta TaxID=13708 RepID=A0AAD8P510_TARER|nr:hypothetical protein QVD17_09120 [Tagetes erecta]